MNKKTLSTDDRIYRLNRRAAIARVVLDASVAVLLILIFVGQQQQNAKITGIESTNQANIASLQKHIDCIVTLFGQQNRSTLSITNISNCQITPVGSNGPINTEAPTTGNPTTSAPQTSNFGSQAAAPSQVSNPAPGQSQNPTPQLPPKPLLCRLTLGLLACS